MIFVAIYYHISTENYLNLLLFQQTQKCCYIVFLSFLKTTEKWEKRWNAEGSGR